MLRVKSLEGARKLIRLAEKAKTRDSGPPLRSQRSILDFSECLAVLGSYSPEFAQELLDKHNCFGHLNWADLRLALGYKASKDNPDCLACDIGKQKQGSLPKQAKVHKRATRVLGRFHLDIFFSRGNRFKFQMAVDDYTRRNFIAVIDSKAEALPAFKKLKMWLEKQKYPLKIAITRTDAENVYIGERFSKFLEGEGIAMEHSSRYKHGMMDDK